MLRKIAISLITFFFAFAVLLISVLRTAEVKYGFSMPKGVDNEVLGAGNEQIDYNLAYPGKILPDNILWPVKAARDKVWLTLTTNDTREAELKLLFADKRLAASKILFDNGNADDGLATLIKAERYLVEAQEKERQNYKEGIDTKDFLRALTLSSLRHRQVIEELLLTAPEDAKPQLSETINYPKKVYEGTMHAFNEIGIEAPKNPFDRY
jgi:hypothetical protein